LGVRGVDHVVVSFARLAPPLKHFRENFEDLPDQRWALRREIRIDSSDSACNLSSLRSGMPMIV